MILAMGIWVYLQASFGVLARENTSMRYPAGCGLYIPYDGEGYLYIVQYIW